MKIAIKLVGRNSGVLDCKIIVIRPDQDQDAVIKNSVLSAVEDWDLSVGDEINVVELP